jgi:hypothetical protein
MMMVRIKIKKMEMISLKMVMRSMKMVMRSLKMVTRSLRKQKKLKPMTSLKEWI